MEDVNQQMMSHSRFEPGSSRTQTHFERYSYTLLGLKCFFLVKTQCSYENGYSIYISRLIGTCVRMRIEENR